MAATGLDSDARVEDETVASTHLNGNGRRSSVRVAAPRATDVEEFEAGLARLERANVALQRENARLARAAHGRAATPAAVRLTSAERAWRERAETAEREAARLTRLLATPRHRAVESARESLLRSRLLYSFVRRIWAWAPKG